MDVLRRKTWSPVLVGALIGVLAWFSFASADEALGVSTSFVRAIGLAESAVAPTHVSDNAYFTKTQLKVDWQMMLVLGIAIGAFISARLSGDRDEARVPAMWAARFGPNPAVRNLGALLGGALVLYGARLAGGCTSGHGLSGGMQLAVSGWLFFGVLFVTGIVAAHLIYGAGARHV